MAAQAKVVAVKRVRASAQRRAERQRKNPAIRRLPDGKILVEGQNSSAQVEPLGDQGANVFLRSWPSHDPSKVYFDGIKSYRSIKVALRAAIKYVEDMDRNHRELNPQSKRGAVEVTPAQFRQITKAYQRGLRESGSRPPTAQPLSSYKGHRIWRDPEGYYRTDADPDTWFESLKDAKALIDMGIIGREVSVAGHNLRQHGAVTRHLFSIKRPA